MSKLQRYFVLAGKNTNFLKNFFNLGFIQASNALVQVLLFPLIIRIVGLESFGYVAVASTYAGLLSLLINYGTNLSGIKDVALAKKDPERLSQIFFATYQTRILLFVLSMVIPLFMSGTSYSHTHYLLFATTIVFAEVVNPLFFFNGIESLFLYNCANLFAKLLSAALIVLFVNSAADAAWVNLYLGVGNALFYGMLSIYAIRKYDLKWVGFSTIGVRRMLKDNFFLVCNNLSAQLQQSLFLFMISSTSSPLVLGAYSLCDKIIWSFRLLLIAFSSAIYPKAAVTYQEKKDRWRHYKKKINGLLGAGFIIAGLLLYFFAPFIVWIFTGGYDELAAGYIRWICFVPLLAALNSMNVIELLIRNHYRYLFYYSLAMMCFSAVAAFIVSRFVTPAGFGCYPVLAEASSLLIFLYFIGRADHSDLPPAASF